MQRSATFTVEIKKCHVCVMRTLYAQASLNRLPMLKECAMDDYQEELLDSQAYELDPLEPADDATEL